jgi:hypothetical protein|tara:strand:+ start:3761 stop:4267 length:507 start_codon:yes stop_codon:yes gene_type:complete
MKANIFLLALFIGGCEDDSIEDIIPNSIEVVTGNIMVSNFYYNLINETEVDSSSTWHLSAKVIQVPFGEGFYGMPSVVLGNVSAQSLDVSYSEIVSPPSENTVWYSNNNAVQYGEIDEVISYNMTTHVASVENPTKAFIIYENIGQTSYKIQFLAYTSGILSFQFQEL